MLDELSSTSGWQTLVTIARESAGGWRLSAVLRSDAQCVPIQAPQRPSIPAPNSSTPGGNDISPEMFDEFMEEGGSGNAAGPSVGSGSGMTVCPHCTFENPHAGGDCDVCGLPLG